MLYVILGFDGPRAKELRPLHRSAHLEKLRRLAAQGRLVLAGPFTDGHGSMIVLHAESRDDAEKAAREDPYAIHGIFERTEVRPFKQVFPGEIE